MRINESTMRRIIREEAHRVLREQGTAQQAGAKIDQTVAAGAAMATLRATPQQVAQIAGTYADVLLSQPVLAPIKLIPGGREQIVGAVTTYLNGHQQVMKMVLSGVIQPARITVEVANLVRNGQIQSTVTTLTGQGKGVAEVIGAVLDLIFSKISASAPASAQP